MSTAAAEQVIVGKMSLPQAQGQISLFVLPQSFVWLKHFTAEEIAEFFAELLEALSQSEQNKDWSFVSDVIEAWKATANIKADPGVSAAVDQGLDELANEQGTSWAALKKDLEL
jgi:hypothetical protein